MRSAPCCKRNQSFWKKIFFTVCCVGTAYGWAVTHVQFVVSATESLPYRFFVLSKRRPLTPLVPQKDKYALFYKTDVGTKVIKQIKGVPGSRIHFDERGRLWVDDFCVGKPRPVSSDGMPMAPLKEGTIPEGFIFAFAPHEKSYDSRYASFGLIPLSSLQGMGVAVL